MTIFMHKGNMDAKKCKLTPELLSPNFVSVKRYYWNQNTKIVLKSEFTVLYSEMPTSITHFCRIQDGGGAEYSKGPVKLIKRVK